MLKEYNKKRNFNLTSEPKGIKNATNKDNLRFVIQYHKARTNHYDFRLEWEGVLLSWAVPKGLSLNPNEKKLAVMVENHPLSYINFEGIIAKGNYGAGSVEIYDFGYYHPIEDFNLGLEKGLLKFILLGEKYKGAFSLIKIDEKNWIIKKNKDEFASLKRKIQKNPFKECQLQLATLSYSIPKGKLWLFEIKYDGYRMVSYVENGKVKILSRNNVDYTKKFEEIAKSLLLLTEESFVVDGEIVSFDNNGRSDFRLLQENLKKGKGQFYYVIFDILALSGIDLRNAKLIDRKKRLEILLTKASKNLVYSSFSVGNGKMCFNIAKKLNLEGIVAKEINSKYIGKRSGDWLKIKCYLSQEFIIIGFTTSANKKQMRSLLLAYYSSNKLKYAGKVGTGFTESIKKELNQMFKKHYSKEATLDLKIKDVIWLKPTLVAQIKYTGVTKNGLLRQPSFIELRNDKDPKNVNLEVHNEFDS